MIVLQHGFFSSAANWKEAGYVDLLTDQFSVACIDSLGHGQSDKPIEAHCYHQSERAADIVAVIDHIGVEKAHLLGYSMGGWLAVGVAKYYPDRLASLIIAGWDFERGMTGVLESLGGDKMGFEELYTNAKVSEPELLAWVTDEIKVALAACFEPLYDLEGAKQAVLDFDGPVLLWNGTEDPYHDPMQEMAAANELQFLSTPGDHMTAMVNSAPIVSQTLKAFIARN